MDLITRMFPYIVSRRLFHISIRFLHCTIFVSQFKFSHLDLSIPNQIPNAFICLDHFIPPILAFNKLLNHKPYILFLLRYKPETSLDLSTSERAFTKSVSLLTKSVVSSAN